MKWVVAMLLVFVTLAGCAEEDSGSDAEQTDSADPDAGTGTTGGETDGSTKGSGGSSGSGGGGAASDALNAAPVPSLLASVSNGTAPLQVNFTIDASDEDGDNVTWTLSTNGTELASGDMVPASANVTFDVVGVHVVDLAVSDGINTTTTSINITVVEAVQEAGFTPVTIDRVTAHGGDHIFRYGEPGACIGFRTDSNDEDCSWFVVEPEWVGRQFSTTSDADSDIFFLTGCSVDADVLAFHDSDGHESGVIPAGTTCALMYDFALYTSTDRNVSFTVV